MFLLDYLQHRRDCQLKQSERARLVASLTAYHGPLSAADKETLTQPIEALVASVHAGGTAAALSVLRSYGRLALKAHARTNCLTEILLPSAEGWLTTGGEGGIDLKGPLAGVPVSLKDTVVVGGYDTTVGYSSFVGNKGDVDGPMVRMLKDAGAVPYVKTNLPISLLSFESGNDVWGRCRNPHNGEYSPGGSTGGESALLAMGGRIGIGSDVAGSVRVPAHFAGCYSLRCSTGRWPKAGIATSMPGQEGVPSVYSPMARTLGDLTYFTKVVLGEMRPWRYDYTVHPLAWRGDVEKEFGDAGRKLRVGVLRTDGVVEPSPACKRALEMAEQALRRQGCEIVEVDGAPDMYEGLKLASLLLNADGCQMFESFRRPGEWLDAGALQMRRLAALWAPFRYLYYLWVRYVQRDHIWAGLVRHWRLQSAFGNWKLVSQREQYRARWFEWWNEQGLDVIISPPNATPAVPHDGMRDAVSSCGYTFLFNLLDYSAGVLPITHVDKALDKLPPSFNAKKLNGVARGAYKHYDAERMHGLPIGVQVVGRRMEEEKVLAVMKRLEDALGDDKAYQNAASFVPKLATKVMQWLDPQKDDVILDVGCGVLDATALPSTPHLQNASFTKAFSNAALHWVLTPPPTREAVFRGVRDALAPGGTFVFEMGGLGNVPEIRAAVLAAVGRRVGLARAQEADPWFFPDEEWVRDIMEVKVGGWVVEKAEREWRPTRADKGGVEGWVRLMAKNFFEVLPEGEREECIREVVDVLEVVCKQPGGWHMLSYVRLRVVARKV
ncbi:Acetamidase [Parachaetomium inaequale]|uniref:amidase n=1 Tax=Parachaetomium inaequale TaxID=2588326 RepID=A0AAN6SU47_9PEZI|nr:Acetamidase [Parachaetomium inaequale]